MKYWLDTEFNGFGGFLISLALVAEDGRECYFLVERKLTASDPLYEEWVLANVIPILACPGASPVRVKPEELGRAIGGFLANDADPVIVADWPDDIRYFCEAVITGPGQMVAIPRLTFVVERVDAYPATGCTLPGAVQHNALWDARALRHLMTA